MYEKCLSPLKLSGFSFFFSLAPFGGQVSNISLVFTLIMNYFFTFVILLYNTFYGMVGWDTPHPLSIGAQQTFWNVISFCLN